MNTKLFVSSWLIGWPTRHRTDNYRDYTGVTDAQERKSLGRQVDPLQVGAVVWRCQDSRI